MKRIGEILQPQNLIADKKNRKTERGELLRFFQRHLNLARSADGIPKLTMGRLGKVLEGIPTQDLYYLQSMCSKAKNFSKKFWWEVDPKKHEEKQPF